MTSSANSPQDPAHDSPVPANQAHRNLENALWLICRNRAKDIQMSGTPRVPNLPGYKELEQAAQRLVDLTGTDIQATRGSLVVRLFKNEPTAILAGTNVAGRIACYSCRDGHFSVPISDAQAWCAGEPTRALLTDLAENLYT